MRIPFITKAIIQACTRQCLKDRSKAERILALHRVRDRISFIVKRQGGERWQKQLL